MSFEAILGHERPIRVLRRALRSGRVPHSYLFWGPDGVGKERVAREVGKALLCAVPDPGPREEGCSSCPACHRVDTGSHPDLHLVAARGATISVDDVRALQEALSYRAFERGRKVAIIRDAFRMTREAANALLKTLEEPPAGTHILLLAHHRNQLLPTLVSRCQSLRFDAIAEDDVRRLLESGGVAREVAGSLAAISDGRPGAVWGEDAEAVREMESEVARAWEAWPRLGVADLFALSSRWASDKERLPLRLDSLERHLRRQARAEVENEAGQLALDTLERLFRVRRLIGQNVNVQLGLDALLLGVGDPDREERS